MASEGSEGFLLLLKSFSVLSGTSRRAGSLDGQCRNTCVRSETEPRVSPGSAPSPIYLLSWSLLNFFGVNSPVLLHHPHSSGMVHVSLLSPVINFRATSEFPLMARHGPFRSGYLVTNLCRLPVNHPLLVNKIQALLQDGNCCHWSKDQGLPFRPRRRVRFD